MARMLEGELVGRRGPWSVWQVDSGVAGRRRSICHDDATWGYQGREDILKTVVTVGIGRNGRFETRPEREDVPEDLLRGLREWLSAYICGRTRYNL